MRLPLSQVIPRMQLDEGETVKTVSRYLGLPLLIIKVEAFSVSVLPVARCASRYQKHKQNHLSYKKQTYKVLKRRRLSLKFFTKPVRVFYTLHYIKF